VLGVAPNEEHAVEHMPLTQMARITTIPAAVLLERQGNTVEA